MVGDAELKVGTNGGSFLHDGDNNKYYMASLKEVIDKFSYLPDMGIKGRGIGGTELTNEQLYDICMSIVEVLRQRT